MGIAFIVGSVSFGSLGADLGEVLDAQYSRLGQQGGEGATVDNPHVSTVNQGWWVANVYGIFLDIWKFKP